MLILDRRLAPTVRRISAALLLMHAVVGFAAVPFAHAMLVDQSPPVEVHVESPDSPNCPTAHSDAQCPGCGLRIASHSTAGTAELGLARVEAAPAPAHRSDRPVVIRFAPLGGRAPPA